MALNAARLVVMTRIHRCLNELVFLVAPMALREIARPRKKSERPHRPISPAMLHPRAGGRVAGAAEFSGPILAAMADRAAIVEQRMQGCRANVQIELRMRAPRIERVVGRILNPLELRDSLL